MSSVAPAAHSEVLEAVLQRSRERPEVTTRPDRRYSVATVIGRVMTFALPLVCVLIVAGPRQAALLLVAMGATYLIGRSVLRALPPAARSHAVAGTAAAVVVAFFIWITLGLVVGTEVRVTGLLLIAVATLALATAFEVWAERHKPLVRVLVVGRELEANELAQGLWNDADSKWSLVGLVDNSSSAANRQSSSELTDLVLSQRADLVVLAESSGRDAALDQLLRVPAPSFRVISFDHFCEYAFGRISVRNVSPLWFMSLLHAYGRPYHRVTKRVLDFLVAAGIFVFALPVTLSIMALVRLSGPGPIFYRQVRVGEAGVPFKILKFRTMTDNAEADGEAAWANENDHRVTRVGRLLRQYRLDELPQLLNVIRGEMSVVGPRPERPEFVAVLEEAIPHWSRRLLVKPGLTGWAQVRMGYTADFASAADKLAFDLYYLKHRGLMLDLAIVLRTVGVVLRGTGAR